MTLQWLNLLGVTTTRATPVISAVGGFVDGLLGVTTTTTTEAPCSGQIGGQFRVNDNIQIQIICTDHFIFNNLILNLSLLGGGGLLGFGLLGPPCTTTTTTQPPPTTTTTTTTAAPPCGGLLGT